MKYLKIILVFLLLFLLSCSNDNMIGVNNAESEISLPFIKQDGGTGTPPVSDVSIQIILPPEVDPSNPVVSTDDLVAFMAVVTGKAGILTFTWNFGDGTIIENGAGIAHSYVQGGTYIVTVSVADTDQITGEILGAAESSITLTVDDIGPQVIIVDIDIKPGSFPNSFNNNGHGVIPVAILGSVDFDVMQVDPATVSLEGLAIKVVGKSNKLLAHIEDVNSDGIDDLLCQIEDSDCVFEVGTTIAKVSGNLYDGIPFEGTDEICIVPIK